MVKVAVVGTAGYSAREAIELLIGHPQADIVSLVSDSRPEGTDVGDIWPRLRGQLSKTTSRSVDSSCDVAILAKPTRAAQEYARELHGRGLRVIDLSASFRLRDLELYEQTYGEKHLCPELVPQAVYGLPEIHRPEVAEATLVANPGCYPVSAILACAPLFKNGVAEPDDVIIDAYSGISGAGRSVADETYLYVERDENITPYHVLAHRHAPEMEQELGALAGREVVASFVPHLAPMARGIMATIHLEPKDPSVLRSAVLREIYETAYADEPFVRLMPEGESPSISNVVGTNFCDIGLFFSERQGRIVILSAIDNLVKGAAGQAIQNMNIMFGLDETAGLLRGAGGSGRTPTREGRPDNAVFVS